MAIPAAGSLAYRASTRASPALFDSANGHAAQALFSQMTPSVTDAMNSTQAARVQPHSMSG